LPFRGAVSYLKASPMWVIGSTAANGSVDRGNKFQESLSERRGYRPTFLIRISGVAAQLSNRGINDLAKRSISYDPSNDPGTGQPP